MEDTELFGELHEREENGLYGRRHAELCFLQSVSNPVKNAVDIVDKQDEKHIIYTINEEVKQAYKKWSFAKCEEVLNRLGTEYWEIG